VGEGAAAGADVDVTAEHTASRTWLWPAANEIVELASGQAKPVSQVLEPEKKKDGKKKSKFGPPKETAWGPLRNECGTWMLTYIDPKEPVKGQPPKAWPSWWDAAKPKSDDWWVRGHLLNEQLGGPGDLKNLTPITQRTNRRHEVQAESLVKDARATHKMLCYFVEPVYGNGPKLADDRAKNPDPSVWPNITEGLLCSWEFIDEQGLVDDSGQALIINEHKD
jgi:hypothetical protein